MTYYSFVGTEPRLITHKFAADVTINGNLPKKDVAATETIDPDETLPGKMSFTDLLDGGLFAFHRKNVIVEELINTNVQWSVVRLNEGSELSTSMQDSDFTVVNSNPMAPLTLIAGEWLRAKGDVTAGQEVGVKVKYNETKIV